jgi:hypothetical protein
MPDTTNLFAKCDRCHHICPMSEFGEGEPHEPLYCRNCIARGSVPADPLSPARLKAAGETLRAVFAAMPERHRQYLDDGLRYGVSYLGGEPRRHLLAGLDGTASHPPDSELPRLSDLRGLFNGLDGTDREATT